MKRLWDLLKRAATRIGRIQAWIILTLFYFILLAPIAVLFRLATRRSTREANPWHPRPNPADPLAWAKAQH
jgi:hypothetical protein